MSTDVWITLITAVIAPVALRIAAHYWPEATPATPPDTPPESSGTGVYDVESDEAP